MRALRKLRRRAVLMEWCMAALLQVATPGLGRLTPKTDVSGLLHSMGEALESLSEKARDGEQPAA